MFAIKKSKEKFNVAKESKGNVVKESKISVAKESKSKADEIKSAKVKNLKANKEVKVKTANQYALPFQDKPIQLISVIEEESKVLQLNPEGVEILKSFNAYGKRLHIISVLGPARSSKSSLLNFILTRLGVELTEESRFITGAGGRTVTKGLWFWGRPIPLNFFYGDNKNDKDSKDYKYDKNSKSTSDFDIDENDDVDENVNKEKDYLLLIDTQGTGLNNDSINTQLSALACMLSSLVILNIDGAVNEEHTTLLGVIRNFINKAPGTPSERQSLFPTLLIRSKDYRRLDFEEDFKNSISSSGELITSLPLSHPDVHAALDEKLTADLSKSDVDPILAEVQKSICSSFPWRHWFITYPTTEEDEEKLDNLGYKNYIDYLDSVLGSNVKDAKDSKDAKDKDENDNNSGENKIDDSDDINNSEHSFKSSMTALLNRIFQLSEPKRFGAGYITMDVLVPHFQSFIDVIREEKGRFHIPTVVDALHHQQVCKICNECKVVYENYWREKKLEDENNSIIETIEDLKLHHDNATEAAKNFYEEETKDKELSVKQRNQGRSRLSIVLQTSFLSHQEKFRGAMFAKMKELKKQAEKDHKRQLELGDELKLLQKQVDGIAAQINSFQRQIAIAEQELAAAKYAKQKAEEDARRAKEEMENIARQRRNDDGGGFCVLC